MAALRPTVEMRTTGDHLPVQQLGGFVEAEASVRPAVAMAPEQAIRHHDLGFALQVQGDLEGAVIAYSKALQLDPSLRAARRSLALNLAQLGEREKSFALFHAELGAPDGLPWMNDAITTAMKARDLAFAGELAAISAALRLGSEWYPRYGDTCLEPLPVCAPERRLSVSKLRHDIQQFEHLQSKGVFGNELASVIAEYRRVVDRLSPLGEHTKTPLEGQTLEAIGHVYNRIIHVRRTPRLTTRTLSNAWDPAEVEKHYLDHPQGVVVVDDFLSIEALNELRQFCLEFDDMVAQSLCARSARVALPRRLQLPPASPDCRGASGCDAARDRRSVFTPPTVGLQERARPTRRDNDPRRLCGGQRKLLDHARRCKPRSFVRWPGGL